MHTTIHTHPEKTKTRACTTCIEFMDNLRVLCGTALALLAAAMYNNTAIRHRPLHALIQWT